MLNEISENWILVLEMKLGSTPLAKVIRIYFLSFSSGKLHKNYQALDKINSHICLMLSGYKSFHQTVKYGRQRNHNTRFNWLEI